MLLSVLSLLSYLKYLVSLHPVCINDLMPSWQGTWQRIAVDRGWSKFICVFHISCSLAMFRLILARVRAQVCEVIKVHSRGFSDSLVIVFSCLLCLSLFLNFKITPCTKTHTSTHEHAHMHLKNYFWGNSRSILPSQHKCVCTLFSFVFGTKFWLIKYSFSLLF